MTWVSSPRRTATASTRRQSERGAVAVEFALLFPLLIVLVFFTVNAGIFIWARFAAMSLAHSAASACSKSVPMLPGTAQTCATAYLAGNAAGYGLNGLCAGGATFQVQAPSIPVGTNTVFVLQTQVNCPVNMLGIPSFPAVNFTWSPPPVTGYAAMPFLIQLPLPPAAPH